MPLGVTRPLDAALRAVLTTSELLVRISYPSLASGHSLTGTLAHLIDAASHVAALRRHPYVSPEHVALAAARESGDARLADDLTTRLAAKVLPITP